MTALDRRHGSTDMVLERELGVDGALRGRLVESRPRKAGPTGPPRP